MDLHLCHWEELRGLWHPCLVQEAVKQARLRTCQIKGPLERRGPMATRDPASQPARSQIPREQSTLPPIHLQPPGSRVIGLLLGGSISSEVKGVARSPCLC